MIDIKSSWERVGEVPLQLLEAATTQISFGVPFLDEALTGLLKTDLCIIGAKSGRGKTQICVDIAKHNLSKGVRVVFIALEAEKNEIEMRLLYQIETGMYFRDELRDRSIIVNYRSWRLGVLDLAFSKYRIPAYGLYKEKYKSLKTVYRDQNFTQETLRELLESLQGEADLIILDHLHYFDMQNGEDNQEMTALIRSIRDLNLFYQVPFIVAAHLKKNIETLLPETEDFHGTGNIGKNATVNIMLTPRPDAYNAKDQTFETIVSIPKSRTGSLGNLCGILYFSAKHQIYSPKFNLGRVYGAGQRVEILKEDEWPEWAKKQSLK